MRKIDETEKCWLDYDEDGYLTCTYNHKAGAECLMTTPTKEEIEEYRNMEMAHHVAEFLNLVVPEIKTDWHHIDPRDEETKKIIKSFSFGMFMVHKAWSRVWRDIKKSFGIK